MTPWPSDPDHYRPPWVEEGLDDLVDHLAGHGYLCDCDDCLFAAAIVEAI